MPQQAARSAAVPCTRASLPAAACGWDLRPCTPSLYPHPPADILVGGDGSDLYVQCDTGDDKRCFGTKDRGSATVFTAHYMGPGAAADRYQYEAQGTGLCLNLWGGLVGVPDQKFGL